MQGGSQFLQVPLGGRRSDEARCQNDSGRQTGKGAELLMSFAEGMAAS